jgi:biopolymer transport protein TolR
MVAGVPIELPNTSASKVSQIKKPMMVSLAADGGLFIRDQQVPRTELVNRLQDIRGAEGDTVVYVRADKRVPYGEVMEILGRVGEGGYPRVSLLSQPGPKQHPAAAPATGAAPTGQ